MADADSKEIVKTNKEIMDETAKQLPALQSIAKSAATLASNQETPESRKERELREANALKNSGDGKGDGKPGKPGKTGGFLGMVKGLGAGIGGIASSFLKFGGFLLKAAFFPITAISAMLTSTAALVGGLVAIAALFVGVGVASFMLTDEEFDKLKVKIAEGVAGVFSKIVTGAVGIYNSFVPDSFKVSEDDKKKMGTATFTAVKDTIVGIIDFAKEIVDAFGKGFSENMKGIKTKFESFTSKIGAVYEKVEGWVSASGMMGAGKTGLMWYVNFLGDALGKFISGILSVANFIADLIIDPQTTLAKLQVSVESMFMDIGRNISDVFGELFSMESINRALRSTTAGDALADLFGMDSLEESSKKAEERKKLEVEARRIQNDGLRESIKETERQLEEEKKLGDKRNDTTIRNLTLAMEREKSLVERNQSSIDRANDEIKLSQDLIKKEQIEAAKSEEYKKIEKENAATLHKIKLMEFAEQQARNRKVYADTEGVGGESFTAKEFEGMKKLISDMSNGTITAADIASGKAELTQKMINQLYRDFQIDKGDVKNKDDAMIVFSKGIDKLSELTRLQANIEKEKAKIVKLEPIEMATGGYVTKTGLAKVHQGELMMDNKAAAMMDNAAQVLSAYLPLSGQALNQLEREKTSQNNGGGTVIANTDASTKQTVVNNYNGSNISPKAQMLSGESSTRVAG